MLSLIRWIFSIIILAAWLALIGTGLYVAMYEPDEEPPTGDIIVALAGNAGKNNGMSGETQARLAKAIELFEAGAAPKLLVTGGGEPPVAEAMRDAAVAAGIPEADIYVENASHSTLQNALFSADIEDIDKAANLLVVTHRYHLPRSWASFRWAGFSNVTRVAADPDAPFQLSATMLWETVKWPLNIVRAAAASAAMAGDVPRENYIKYLE